MFKIYDGRDKFYQWDLDRKIIVNDNTIKQVHFCNRTDDCSLVVETYELDGLTVADVPNVLLQTNWKINVYGYTGDYTKHSTTFEVVGRTKPTDYVYTETETMNWQKINEEVNTTINEALAEVDTKISDGISDISNRVDEVSSKVNEANSIFSNVVKGNESGEIVRLDDISPVESDINVEVSSKNLFDYKDWINWTATTGGGGSWDENAIYLDEECFMYRNYKQENSAYKAIQFKENTQYTFTCEFSFSYNNLESYKNMPVMTINYADGSVAYLRHQEAYSTKFQKITFTSAANKTISHLSNSGFSQGCMVYIKKNMIIEEGITATAYTPYIADLDTVKVKAQGKNFINPTAYLKASNNTTLDGDVFTTTFTNQAVFINVSWTNKQVKNKAGTYTFSLVPVSGSVAFNFYVYKVSDNSTIDSVYDLGANGKMSHTFTAKEEFYISIGGATNSSYRNKELSFKIQLELGNTATKYEPYVEVVSYPVENGNCQVKPIYPTTTIGVNTDGVIVDCEYNRDINKVIEQLTQAIISLGGNV